MKSRRLGKFDISFQLVEESQWEVSLILSLLGFIPIRVEAMYANNSFEYVGISDRFREVSPAEVIPIYEIEVQSDEDGITKVDVEEIKL